MNIGDCKVKTAKSGFNLIASNELILRPLKRVVLSGGVFIAAACAAEYMPASLGEAERPPLGLVYAKENCAVCHAVEAGEEQSPDPAAPTFEALASRPDMSRMALSALLQTPHRTMPNLIVEPDRIDELSAYISTLRKDNL